MNERIEKAMYDAGLTAQGCWDEMDSYAHKAIIKFAELIVRECIGCCEQVISDPVPKSVDTWLNGGSQCIAEIKEHFGVEE